jgi:PAS domain S-box-containing protein
VKDQLGVSEERLSLLIDSVKDYAIFMLDPNGIIESWNDGAERISGYTASEAMGKHIAFLYTPEDRHSNKAWIELDTALKEGRYEEEGWRVCKNGHRFWANVVITPVFDSPAKLLGFAKVTRDISQRKQLTDTEERFRLLVESVNDYAIFMLDPTGHIVSWNPGAERIKGYKIDEVLGKHFSLFYTSEDVERKHPDHELEIAKAEGRFEEEGWRVRKDGTRFWANVVITAVHEKDGVLRGFAKVTRDMTHRREMEEQLREVNRQLEAFAYSVAHDLRAPLRNMSFTSRLLLEDYGDKLDEEGKELLTTQSLCATKLAAIISDLLTLTRLSRKALRLQQVNMSSLAAEVWDELILTARAEVLPTPLIAPDMKVRGDKTLLRMILLNLLDNAIKFSPNGGTVEIGELMQDGHRVFYVKDEGVGFDMAYVHKIFLPFERLVNDEESPGSGIGLANVQQAVLRHGGRVWAESELGKGSTLYFYLR